MTDEMDLTPLVRSWLRDTLPPATASSHLLEAVDEQVPTIRQQRHPWPPLPQPRRPSEQPAVDPALTDQPRPVPTTQGPTPKWRFQSMFSALKFLVAGAIVALFGGMLLAGVLTQPTDEAEPALGSSGTPGPAPSAALELRSGELARDSSGGFGVASPRWATGVVESSRGGSSHIDWYEPDGVVSRELYTMTCDGLCEFVAGTWPPSSEDMGRFPSEPHLSDTPDGPSAGVIYPMPEPPADIWWTVRLEFDPSSTGCDAHLDAEGRCFVESGPWRWLTVPEGEPEVISLWGEDFTEGGSGTTQLDWYEPEGVVDRRVYFTTCTPDCEGTIPTKDEMGHYTEHQVWASDDGRGQVGLLFRQPGPGPAEVWWMVELDFPPDHPRCKGSADGCTLTGGPWRYYVHPLFQANSFDEVQPGVFRLLRSDGVDVDGDVVDVALSDGASVRVEMADGRTAWLLGRDAVSLDPFVETTSSPVIETSRDGAVVATVDGRVVPEVQTQTLVDGTILRARRAVVESSGYVWTVFEDEAGSSSLFVIRPGARDAEALPTVQPPVDAATNTTELLPGVDLVTEEIEPGVFAVTGDGAGHGLPSPDTVEVTSGGTAWVSVGRRLVQLGRAGSVATGEDQAGPVVTAGRAGELLLASGRDVLRLDSASDPDRRGDVISSEPLGSTGPDLGGASWVTAISAAPDSVWASWSEGNAINAGETRLFRFDGEVWEDHSDESALGGLIDLTSNGNYICDIAGGPTGETWVGVCGAGGQGFGAGGLFRYDGSGWERVAAFADAGRLDVLVSDVMEIAIGSDGTTWAFVLPTVQEVVDAVAVGDWSSIDDPVTDPFLGSPMLARYQNGAWSFYRVDAVSPEHHTNLWAVYSPGDFMDVDDHGVLWVLAGPLRDGSERLLAFDGETVREYTSVRNIRDLSVDGQGRVWLATRNGLRVIDPTSAQAAERRFDADTAASPDPLP